MNYQKFLKDGELYWTLTSNGYKFLTWNFYNLWKKAMGARPLCIVCADMDSYQFLRREGVPCIAYESLMANFGPNVVPFGSRQFSMLNRLKLRLLNTFAGKEDIQTCVYLDGDIAVYQDFSADLRQRLLEHPIWAQCDEQQHACSETADTHCPNFCTGLVAWKHGADQGIFKVWDEDVWKSKPEDQVWVNYAAAQKVVRVATLPRDLYPNGARLTLTKTNQELNQKCFLLHYNYRVGDSKKADMRRFGDWTLIY